MRIVHREERAVLLSAVQAYSPKENCGLNKLFTSPRILDIGTLYGTEKQALLLQEWHPYPSASLLSHTFRATSQALFFAPAATFVLFFVALT